MVLNTVHGLDITKSTAHNITKVRKQRRDRRRHSGGGAAQAKLSKQMEEQIKLLKARAIPRRNSSAQFVGAILPRAIP